jgi:hypothetical protein
VGTPRGAFVVDRGQSILTGEPRPGSRGERNAELAARAVTAKGTDSDLLATERFLAIAETSLGEIWLGSQDEGILAVTPASADAPDSGAGEWRVRHIHHDNAVPTTLSDDMVNALYLGKPGIVWAGTRRGVSYLDTNAKSVFTMQSGTGHDSVIRDTNVYSVLARADGSVWLALSKDGIDILDAGGRKTAELRTGTTNPETMLPPGTLNGLIEGGDGSVLIPTQRGLYRATPSKSGGRGQAHQRDAGAAGQWQAVDRRG